MIYTLTIECIRGAYLEEKCVRVLEIEKDASLYSLHHAIHEAVHFGFDHPHKFFISSTGNPWGKISRPGNQENEDQDDWDDMDWDVDDLKLENIWPLGRKKLYYLFDYGDDWVFEIRKARGEKEADKNASYPRIIKSIGPNPKQYPNCEE